MTSIVGIGCASTSLPLPAALPLPVFDAALRAAARPARR